MVGLPVYLWEIKILKQLGDTYEACLDVDKLTGDLIDLQWVCILVWVDDRKLLQALEVKVSEKRLFIQLWWEFPQVGGEASSVEARRTRVVEKGKKMRSLHESLDA